MDTSTAAAGSQGRRTVRTDLVSAPVAWINSKACSSTLPNTPPPARQPAKAVTPLQAYVPFENGKIAENAAVDGGAVVARMLSERGNLGFYAARKDYVDLVEEGIIDPVKVVRVAPENAVSVASVLLLLTKGTMTESPESKKEHPAEPDMGI